MLKERNWLHVLLLSMLTGGIYNTYVWYCQFAELNIISEEKDDKQIPYWLFLVLEIVTGSIYGFVLMAIYRKKAVEVLDAYQVKTKLRSPILYSLLMYLPFISFYIHETEHNKLIRAYNQALNAKTSANEDVYAEFSVEQ